MQNGIFVEIRLTIILLFLNYKISKGALKQGSLTPRVERFVLPFSTHIQTVTKPVKAGVTKSVTPTFLSLFHRAHRFNAPYTKGVAFRDTLSLTPPKRGCPNRSPLAKPLFYRTFSDFFFHTATTYTPNPLCSCSLAAFLLLSNAWA